MHPPHRRTLNKIAIQTIWTISSKWPPQVRKLNTSDHMDLLQMAVKCFRREKHHSFAKETILKIGDIPALISLHMANQRWEEAFQVCQQHPEHSALLYLPYAEYLKSEDDYDGAIDSYREAGRCDLSFDMLTILTDNATTTKQYKNVGHYCYKIAAEICLLAQLGTGAGGPSPSVEQDIAVMVEQGVGTTIDAMKAGGGGGSSSSSSSGTVRDRRALERIQSIVANYERRFSTYTRRSEIYYLYNLLHDFTESPFTTMLPENVLNVCLTLVNLLIDEESHQVFFHLFGAWMFLLCMSSLGRC